MIKIDWHNDADSEIQAVMGHFGTLSRLGLYETIDLQLRFIDLTACAVLLLTALRINFQRQRAGTILTEWESARDRIRDELVNRGEDAKKILHGLYPEDWL